MNSSLVKTNAIYFRRPLILETAILVIEIESFISYVLTPIKKVK